jgi:hypothetical protein
MSFKVGLGGRIKQILLPQDYIMTEGIQLSQFTQNLGTECKGRQFWVFSMAGGIAELP